MGGNGSKAKVEDLKAETRQLKQQVSALESLAVPQWRQGDRRFFEIHETAWQRNISADSDQQAARQQQQGGAQAAAATDVPHPSERLMTMQGEGTLSLDDIAPYGDDMVLSALLILRKTSTIHTVSLANAAITDAGANLLATAIVHHPAPPGGGPPPRVRCSARRLVLPRNPGITAYGARRLAQAFLTRPQEVNAQGALDLRDCPNVFAGSAEDTAAFDSAVEALQQQPSFSVLLPPRPEVPFPVDGGASVRVSDFQVDRGATASHAATHLPLEVRLPSGGALWLHREDIRLKSADKAEALVRFLKEVQSDQARILGRNPHSVRKPYELGSCFLAPVVHAEQRAKLTAVTIVKMPAGRTYAQRVQEAEETGVKLPRSVLLQIFMQLAAAVGFSHKHGFAIRSLRPDLLVVELDRGAVQCHYMDYSALRQEAHRTAKQSVGCRMTFSDPSVVAGGSISRSQDSYPLAMMVVYAYCFVDVLDHFKRRQFGWVRDNIRPASVQATEAIEHYTTELKIDRDIAEIVVALSRPDAHRMSCEAAAEAFFRLMQEEGKRDS